MKQIMPWLYRGLLGISIAFLVAGVVMFIRGEHQRILPMVSGAMLCVALASGGFVWTRTWAFLLWLSTAIVAGMAFPSWFIGVGDFKFTRLFIRGIL